MDPITKALLSEFVAQHELSELAEDKQFEHFSAFSVISSRYADEFDTDDVVIGGGNDLGIDAFAVLVNGRLVEDDQGVAELLRVNGYLDVEFVFVQAKRSAHFDGGEILKFCENIKSIVFGEDEGVPTNDDIKRLMEIRKSVYQAAAKLKGNPECRLYYVTTGHWTGDQYLETIIAKKSQELTATNLFSNVKFEPVGANQLQDLYRATKTSIEKKIKFEKYIVLPPIEKVTAAYLGVLPSTEYLKLITDDESNVIKSIFIDNVRDFQGSNPVNVGIAETISNGFLDQFSLRNNGVTIVARDLNVTGFDFTLRDYQVVNGCQTSHVLYSNRDGIDERLLVPVKIIFTDDEEIAQDVIKSTNRQTPIEENDLLALTKFQRDLEIYYNGFEYDQRLYYERRSRQYAASNVDKARIVPIGIQLKVFASMFLDTPHQAGRYQATLLASVKDRAFKADHRPEPYYTSAYAFYRFDSLLKKATGETAKLKAFKFLFLTAFRYLHENSDLPSLHNKKISAYCDHLNNILWDKDKAQEAFTSCSDLIVRAAAQRGLALVRDSAKVRELVDAVRVLASAENAFKKEVTEGA